MELRGLKNLNSERMSEAEADFQETETSIELQRKRYYDFINELDDLRREEESAICNHHDPQVEAATAELSEHEEHISSSVQQIDSMKQRLLALRDNMKDTILEFSAAVAKEEIDRYDQEEAELRSKIAKEETEFGHLTGVESELKLIITTVQTKLEQQLAKAEKVMGILISSRGKLGEELRMITEEKNKFVILDQHLRDNAHDLSGTIEHMKLLAQETLEAMEQYPKYREERSRSNENQFQFTTNKQLNKIISLDNIFSQDLEDSQRLMIKLTKQLEVLDARHNEIMQRLGEVRRQHTQAVDAARQISLDMNRVMNQVSVTN